MSPGSASAGPTPSEQLAADLQLAVQNAAFDEVVDFEYDTKGGPAPQVANQPNVDVAVIELDALGNPTAAANVLFSRDYPDGKVVAARCELRPERRRLASMGPGSVGWRLERSVAKRLAPRSRYLRREVHGSVPRVHLQTARCLPHAAPDREGHDQAEPRLRLRAAQRQDLSRATPKSSPTRRRSCSRSPSPTRATPRLAHYCSSFTVWAR